MGGDAHPSPYFHTYQDVDSYYSPWHSIDICLNRPIHTNVHIDSYSQPFFDSFTHANPYAHSHSYNISHTSSN